MTDQSSQSQSLSSSSDSGQSTPPTPTIVIQQGSGFSRGFGRLFRWAGWIGVVLCLITIGFLRYERSQYYDNSGGVQERYHSGPKTARDKVAIISIRGVIFAGDGFVKQQIDRIREDPQVKAVVVRVDSPGGTVNGSDYIYHHLDRLRREKKIPIVVSMGGIAASGGYYVSMAVGNEADVIFAEPTTTTGSIGVIIPHYDLSRLLNEHGVFNDSIASHERKQMLSMTKAITPEHRELLQSHVNQLFERFKRIVGHGRPALRASVNDSDTYPLIDGETGRDLATGELFTATEAKELGLVDRIGFLEEAIERAAELAGLPESSYRVVQFRRPASLMEVAGFAQSQQGGGLELSALLDLNTPRAYYIASTLPPLVASERAN